ncbi:MAG: hypothetical protein Q9173_001174 [Seirophora scorigena]
MHVFAFALLCQSLYPYACSALLVEMLRLAATRITLDHKDTALHVRRHEKRMEDCRQATSNPQSHPSSPRFHDIPNEFWPPSSRTRRPSPQESPIYSDEPVPRDSQAFWDRIIADAGSSATVHHQSLARSPQVIVPSAASLENNGSVRLSIRGENEDEDEQNQSNHSIQEPLVSPRSPVSESSSTPSPEVQSSGSQSSLPSLDRQENRLRTQPRQRSLEQTEPYSSAKEDTDSDVTLVNRLSRSPVRESFDRDSPWASQMDLDGPSDAAPSLQHHRSASSLQDPEPGSVGMPFRAQARRAELAASRSAASRTNEPLSGTELRNSSSGQTRYADPQPAQHIRTRSGGLQRSRLYISEAAASSSPDKRQLSPPRSDDAGPADEGYLLPVPRRRERHKHRSQSYSHIASDASATPCSPQGSIHHHPTSSPYHRSNVSHSNHSSSSYPYGMSPHSRHDSSVELPYTSPNPLRRTFEPHAPPFRVASRTPSTNAPFPPDYAPADENGRYSGSPYLPSTPSRSLSSPNIAATPSRISIYNDNQSPSAQPQTPIGLPRHGIPPMPMQNPFFTAPVRAGARIRQGAAGWLHSAFATPSRAERRREVGGWARRHEQENVGVDVEAQRRERIEEEERLRTGHTRSGRAWRMSDWER